MVTGVKTKLEYDDLAAAPNDGQRYELLDGDLYVAPAPSPLHQRVSKRLQRQLEGYFERQGLGEVFNAPTDVILSRRDVVQPDLVVVAQPSQVSARAVEGAPLLAVELLSPSSLEQDRGVKATRYAVLGVAHYWIVDVAAKTIECYRLRGSAYDLVLRTDESSTLTHPDWPGLAIEVAALWRGPQRS